MGSPWQLNVKSQVAQREAPVRLMTDEMKNHVLTAREGELIKPKRLRLAKETSSIMVSPHDVLDDDTPLTRVSFRAAVKSAVKEVRPG